MNCGVLTVISETDVLVCGLYIIPHEMLLPVAPTTLYTQPQIDALLIGRAWLPALDSLPNQPSILQLASAIPTSLPNGSTLPFESVLKVQGADVWTATATYFLVEAEIVPMCNPSEVSPTLETAWGMAATITFSTGSRSIKSRGVFNPDDYESPVSADVTDVYFPKPANFVRIQFEIMRDNASAAGIYWYRSYALLRPSYIFLYQTPGSPFLNHAETDPPHPYLSVSTDTRGVVLSDQAFMFWNDYYQIWVRIDAYSSKWYNTLTEGTGYRQEALGPSGIAGHVLSTDLGHWTSPDVPVRVRPKKLKKAGIAPVVASLLLLSIMFWGTSNPTPSRRRRKM